MALVERSKDRSGSLGITLLRDLRTVFTGQHKLSTDQILTALCKLDEAPWRDLRGKPLDARGLAYRLARYDIHPRKLREGPLTFRGYAREDLADSWARYLPEEQEEQATLIPFPRPVPEHPTPAGTNTPPLTWGVPGVPDVPDVPGTGEERCLVCTSRLAPGAPQGSMCIRCQRIEAANQDAHDGKEAP